ncbi:MAG: hypothetical protein K0R99_1002 [Microbacterium sp.]|jgi:hypothetical protein|nr:hypothetical protein [Microbacterium sp.]
MTYVAAGDLRMCQVRDPWGNCVGVRGPASAHVAVEGVDHADA